MKAEQLYGTELMELFQIVFSCETLSDIQILAVQYAGGEMTEKSFHPSFTKMMHGVDLQ